MEGKRKGRVEPHDPGEDSLDPVINFWGIGAFEGLALCVFAIPHPSAPPCTPNSLGPQPGLSRPWGSQSHTWGHIGVGICLLSPTG